MVRLFICEVEGGVQGNAKAEKGEDEWVDAKQDLLRAEAELLRAEAGRLRAEGLMFEDIGSYYKELASKAEAEAFMAQADRETHELVQGEIRKLKAAGTNTLLVVEKARLEIERDIARNKDLATKTNNRSAFARPGNGRNGDQRKRVPIPVPEKEVAGASRMGGEGVKGGEQFNTIRGAQAITAMKTESES